MKNLTVVIYSPQDNYQLKQSIENAEILSKFITIVYPNSPIVETVREIGIKKAQTEWVLIIDADERISLSLSEEIKKTIQQENFGAYKIPRKNIFTLRNDHICQKKWLRWGGWWPDYQIRLINKKNLICWPKVIHASPIIKGKIGTLSQPIYHYFHSDLRSMVNKTIVFETIEAELLFEAKKKASTLTFFRKFFGELGRRLVRNRGFLDGSIGILESIYQAFSKTITYLFLYEKIVTDK
ncbi:MAG: hypothetical protein NZL96_01365 [Patescibacteria group bacterium]|nr:hypothetical protein [Patescibacteria group bacterium]